MGQPILQTMASTNKLLTIEFDTLGVFHRDFKEYLYIDQWGFIESLVLQRAGHCCQFCGDKQGLQAYAAWATDQEMSRVFVDEILAVCQACWQVKNLPLYSERNKPQLLFQLKKVNGWDELTAVQHFDQQWDYYEQLLKTTWQVDVGKQIAWVSQKVPIKPGFLVVENKITQQRAKILAYIKPNQTPAAIDSLFDSYHRQAYRNQNSMQELKHLDNLLKLLTKEFGEPDQSLTIKQIFEKLSVFENPDL